MNPDMFLTIGIVAAVLAIPGMMSAISDRRAPRASMLTILVAFVFIGAAFYYKPGGYTVDQLPGAFMAGLAGFLP